MAKKKSAPSWRTRLKAMRERLDITQAEAALRAGIPLRTWISWENNQRRPSAAAVKLLALTWPDHFGS